MVCTPELTPDFKLEKEGERIGVANKKFVTEIGSRPEKSL